MKVQGKATRLMSVVFCPIKEHTFVPVVFAESTVAGAVHLDANVEFLTPLLEEEGPNGAAFQKCKACPHFHIAILKGFLRWDVSTETDKQRPPYHKATSFP